MSYMRMTDLQSRSIIDLERSLGFWWPSGLARQSGTRAVPPVSNFLDEMQHIVSEYASLSVRQLRCSRPFGTAVKDFTTSIGHEVWPDGHVCRKAWLVEDPQTNNLGGLYNVSLFYSNTVHREK